MSGQNTNIPQKVASPIATGQAGGIFEQHVGASWLSLLLVKGIPPLILDTQVTQVAFQTARLGWATDDLLVIGETTTKKTRKLACQVKRDFRVSSSNDECRKTFLAFWKDFKGKNFDRSADRFALITLRGTNNLLVHLASLFECATSSQSKDEFQDRFKIEGLLHSTAKGYAEEIRKGLVDDKETVSDEEFWQFLRSLSVLSFDLNTTTSQTEAWLKSLLAHTANGADKIGAAKVTWDALLVFAGKAMPGAMEVSREALPQETLSAHTPIADKDYLALTALKDHSALVIGNIKSTIGTTLKLNRTAIVNSAAEQLAVNRIVILSGPSGTGKSGVAKMLTESLGNQYFVFSFRSEEFEKAHLDETLNVNGIGLSGKALSTVLAGQRTKIVLIESLERLLEASVRDSFSHLLQLATQDDSWKIVITCRSYSLETVISSFFGQMNLPYAVVEIPELSDDELKSVENSIPTLVRPLTNQVLRKVLRNPYVLDKAARMPWPSEETLPANEREFRRKFWKEIVREDHNAGGGLPRRREQILTEVVLRRARALSLYARCYDLDAEALSKLNQSDLISFSKETDTLATPAHDVLEDWTLLNWLEVQAAQQENDPKKIADIVGTYPALRRAYRMWLYERSKIDPQTTDAFVHSVLQDQSLASHFRDDTIVSILKSDSGADFLLRNRNVLLADDARLLKRVVHLLRVACRAMPDWLERTGYIQSSVMVPTGAAWPQALALVREALPKFIEKDSQLALGLIEDWVNIISMESPYPDGHEDAAKIAFALLEVYGGYRYDKNRKKIFSILSKLPTGDKDSFLEWLKRAETDDRDRDAEEFADFLIEGIEGFYCTKEYPDEMIQVFKSRLYSDEEPDSYGHIDIEDFFGLQQHREFFPPSAYRGIFFPLLQNHLKKGIDFIIEFINRACDRYAHPMGHERLEPPWEVELTLPDGTKIKQWHNPRLWQLHRGTSVGPYVMMCALMALEHWLLLLAKAGNKSIDAWLSYIVSKSNNSALSSVVASVVIAYPRKTKETAKILLRCRDYVEIAQNMGAVDRGMSSLQQILPSLNSHQLYESERKESDNLPHRSSNLGLVALDLQITDATIEIQQIIDDHLQILPAKEIQNSADKVWRLTLHKMDLRKFLPKEATKKQLAQLQGKSDKIDGDPEEKTGVIFEPQAPEADLVEVIESARPGIEDSHNRIGLLNWAWACFSWDSKAKPDLWREYLAKAMATKVDFSSGMNWDTAPALVAAVCARDHWTQLNVEQKKWCLELIGNAVSSEKDSDNFQATISKNAMSADRPSALCVASVAASEPDTEYGKSALSILTDALFHTSEEVSKYAAGGIGQFLLGKQPDIALKYVRALVVQAIELNRLYEIEQKKKYNERLDFHELHRNVTRETRKSFHDGHTFQSGDFTRLDYGTPFGEQALKTFLHIFGYDSKNPNTKTFYSSLASQLNKWWQSKDKDERTPFELVHACQQSLATFILRLPPKEAVDMCEPLLSLAQSKTREASEFLRSLAFSVDKYHDGKETFWAIWDAFASKIKSAPWLKRADSDHFPADDLLQSIFLGLSWNKGTRSWEPQKGYEDRVLSLFEALPASRPTFYQMTYYLHHIGDVTLPNSFVSFAKKLRENPSALVDSSAIYWLEQVLQRHVYGTPHKLKAKTEIREAVISILDELVEKGSSAAFKMRDDFVTPMQDRKT